MRAISLVLCSLSVIALASCHAASAPADDPGLLIREQAKVMEVDPLLGQVLLDVAGRQVWAYWQTQAALATDGTMSRGPMGAPVGDYKPVNVRDVPFPAQPGDTIAFTGMMTGDEILLRRVTILSH